MFNKCDTDTNSEMQATSSKELLYSEYMGVTDAEHAVKLLESKKKSKPVMQFESSSVMDRVKKLLPLLEQGQNDLNEKPSEENNIEVIEGESFIEMSVALLRKLNGDNNDSTCEPVELEANEDMESSSNFEQYEESDSSDSNTESESEDISNSDLSDECQTIVNDDQHSEKLISVIEEETVNNVVKES